LKYAALYHSFSLVRKILAPPLRVTVGPLLGVAVPPSSVYALISVLAIPCPLFS
jgi:hypothetical protein